MSLERKILVVDDEEVICQSCQRIFGGQGFLVETSTDSRTGLHLAAQNRYDAIVVDVRMPMIDGIRFLECLREISPAVPVVVISGRAGEAAEAAVARLGAAQYLPKPFTPAEIIQAVRRSMAGA
jgi:DNA-binding response OmpR family regulator